MITSDSPYYPQVRLLVSVLPVVAREQCFALKGGTAINLFVRDMLRLSVDIDLQYLPINDRAAALEEIDASLGRIGRGLAGAPFGYGVHVSKTQDGYACGLVVTGSDAGIKIDVSPVLRGTVFPVTVRRIVERAEAEFGFAEVPVVSLADLYAGKIMAALDRQHPRDLYDVMLLMEHEGVSDDLFRAFMVYLISHDGSMLRVLNPTRKPLEDLFTRQFAGMTEHPVALLQLKQAREDLINTIYAHLGQHEREFLLSFKRGAPRWDLLGIDHADQLPAVRWKQLNLDRMTAANRQAAIDGLQRLFQSL